MKNDFTMLTLEHEFENSGIIIEKDHFGGGQENPIMKNLNLSVIHSENKQPISNALISIESIGKTAICNSEGEVCLTELKPGKYDVDVISPGFIAQTVSVLIPIDEPAKFQVKMISNS